MTTFNLTDHNIDQLNPIDTVTRIIAHGLLIFDLFVHSERLVDLFASHLFHSTIQLAFLQNTSHFPSGINRQANCIDVNISFLDMFVCNLSIICLQTISVRFMLGFTAHIQTNILLSRLISTSPSLVTIFWKTIVIVNRWFCLIESNLVCDLPLIMLLDDVRLDLMVNWGQFNKFN